MAQDVRSASKRGGSLAIREKRGYSSTLQNFGGQAGATRILGKIATGMFLLVIALASCETIGLVDEAGETGTVRVTVNGFHADATAAGTLSGTIDGQDLEITLPPPSDGTSFGEATDAPVGTYDVTYTPPNDHGLSSADLGMEIKSVTVSATDVGDLTWGLEPKTGTVLVTITGLSNAATEAGTIGGDLAITLSAPSAGTSTGESDEVLIGTYDVTYTAPNLHRLIAAEVGLDTKQAMVADDTAFDLGWGVELMPVVDAVDVSPNVVTLAAGDRQQLTATPRDAAGNAITGLSISWSTSNAPVATVDDSGNVTAVANGDAVITATASGVSGTAAVTVDPTAPSAGLLFSSNWSTATGTSDAAVRDTDKALPWTTPFNMNGKRVDTGLQMSVATNTVFPNQSFANMLRVNQYGRASGVVQENLPIPAIGEHRYYRFYLYSDVGVDELFYGFSGNHPVELQFDNSEQELWGVKWGHRQGDSVMTNWSIAPQFGVWPNNVWEPGDMFERTVYRIEIHMERTGNLSFTLDMRIYDGGNPGTLLFDNADFNNRNNSMTLAAVPTFTYPNAQQWTGFAMGGNGELGDPPIGNTPIINGVFYYGAMCIRADTWCGPYAGGI